MSTEKNHSQEIKVGTKYLNFQMSKENQQAATAEKI